MKSLITASGILVGFANIESLNDSFVCDGTIYQHSVVGADATIGVWVEPPAAPPVPSSITRFQALAALHNAGLLESTIAAVNLAPALTKLAWDNTATFERNNETLNTLSTSMGLSSTQLDNLFIAGALITT